MLTGNREFNESYENYKNLILRTAYTYSGNREAAEDITQETFLKLYIGYEIASFCGHYFGKGT